MYSGGGLDRSDSVLPELNRRFKLPLENPLDWKSSGNIDNKQLNEDE